MKTTPKVSVLIPTYNYAYYLDETIQSVLDQTFTDFELIIVDNCSTDNSDEVIKKYLFDKRISYYRNEKNIGLVGNWNKCLEYAKGAYIKFLCADDKFFPGILQQFVTVMDQNPDVSIITSYAEVFGLVSCCRLQPHPLKGKVSSHVAAEKLLKEKNWFYAPTSVMFRKSAVARIGMFNPKLFNSTDLEYYLRLLTLGDAYVLPECLSYQRSHPNTQTKLLKNKKYEVVLERYAFINSIKEINTPRTNITPVYIDAEKRIRATRCAALMYQLLPKLYKKQNRVVFKKAFDIGLSEGVLFKPFSYLFQKKYLNKIVGSIFLNQDVLTNV